jgi:hypothetical protein
MPPPLCNPLLARAVARGLMSEAQARDVEQGAADERDRVLAHLTLGEASGDMTIAREAIASGAGMTAELTARYMRASLTRAAPRPDRGRRAAAAVRRRR